MVEAMAGGEHLNKLLGLGDQVVEDADMLIHIVAEAESRAKVIVVEQAFGKDMEPQVGAAVAGLPAQEHNPMATAAVTAVLVLHY